MPGHLGCMKLAGEISFSQIFATFNAIICYNANLELLMLEKF